MEIPIIVKGILIVMYLVVLVLLSNFCKKVLKFSDEFCRKMIHTLLGPSWFLLWLAFWRTPYFVIMGILGILIGDIGIKSNFLAVLRRDNGDNEHLRLGIFLFTLNECIMCITAYCFPFTLAACTCAMMAVAFGDGPAAVIGRRWGKYTPKLYGKKSVAGSSACFIFALIAMIGGCHIMGFSEAYWKFIVLALVATIAELFGKKYDNLIIGLAVLVAGIVIGIR